jgi:hypothetical protein
MSPITTKVSNERRTSSTSILAGLEPKYATIAASLTPCVMTMTDSTRPTLDASRCWTKRTAETA